MVRWNAEKIRELRERHGENQIIFARRLGVTPTALRFWEWGKQRPNGSALLLLDRIEEDLDNGQIRELQEV